MFVDWQAFGNVVLEPLWQFFKAGSATAGGEQHGPRPAVHFHERQPLGNSRPRKVHSRSKRAGLVQNFCFRGIKFEQFAAFIIFVPRIRFQGVVSKQRVRVEQIDVAGERGLDTIAFQNVRCWCIAKWHLDRVVCHMDNIVCLSCPGVQPLVQRFPRFRIEVILQLSAREQPGLGRFVKPATGHVDAKQVKELALLLLGFQGIASASPAQHSVHGFLGVAAHTNEIFPRRLVACRRGRDGRDRKDGARQNHTEDGKYAGGHIGSYFTVYYVYIGTEMARLMVVEAEIEGIECTSTERSGSTRLDEVVEPSKVASDSREDIRRPLCVHSHLSEKY